MHFWKRKNQISPSIEGGSLKGWFLAIRPNTLFASISPVIIGGAMAYKDHLFHLPSFLLALFGALFIQIGTNLSNDYYDFFHGIDSEKRLGPVRVTQKGIIKPESVKRGFLLSFFLAALAGIYLLIRGGLPILIIGIISIILGILYTAGPFPISYYGIAEPFVIIFFGPIAVAGTYYVQALSIKKEVIIAGFAPGFISNAILTVNNLRDINTDKEAGKKSLVVRFGKRFGRMEYVFSLFVAFVIPFFLLSKTHFYHLLSCLSFVFIIPYLKIIWQDPNPIYNKLLKKTSSFLFIYSLLFSAGWIFS